MFRVGQNRIYTPYMTVYLVIFPAKNTVYTPFIHMVLANSTYMHRMYMVLASPNYFKAAAALS